jgi:two-component system, OmpR family, sensor histidine kinase BaeS
LKFPIGYRLFLAAMLSIVAVMGIGVELARWTLFDNFSEHRANNETERLDHLSDALAMQYRRHHDWSFLPVNAASRKIWLRDEFALAGVDYGAMDTRPSLATLGNRIGLLDDRKHYLAGVMVSPLMVAITSIDTHLRPLVVDDKTVGYLAVAMSQNPDDELAVAFLVQQQKHLLIVAVVSLFLSALVAAWFAANIRKPIRQLVDGAKKLEEGRFEARLTIHRNDELGELAYTFNHLAAKLDATEQSRRQWVADTSHELRTPLSVLRGQMEALQDGIRTATPENIAVMLRQVHALTKLVDELYQLARTDIGKLPYTMVATELWSLVRDVVDGFAERFDVAGLTVSVGAPPVSSIVYCDIDRMRQVITNVLENCVRYTDRGGRIHVHGDAVGNEWRIVIDDSAPGVPASAMERLGERFFRVESSRNRARGGAGLGLALCRQILEAHAGRLEFGPSPLGGLRATLACKLEG